MTQSPDNVDDRKHMRLALELAARGWGRVSPNPLVGAVIVRDGEIVGRGWHAALGGPHAEVEAIRDAGELTQGSTIYVSLEPCAHHGRTGPCTEAIIAAGIRRVVFAAADPTEAGGGAEFLRSRGVEVVGGLDDADARRLNRPFFRAADRNRAHLPWTQLKLAVSLDGRISDADGRSKWITGREAREEVHRLRAGADAIAIGIGTAIADDPSLTVRGPVAPRVHPVRVVFDRKLRLPADGQLARSASDFPLWVVCSPTPPVEARSRLEASGARILEAESLTSSLELLRQEGIRSLLCEGGAGLAASLLNAELVDSLTLFVAPLLLGPAGQGPFDGLHPSPLADAHRWTPVRTEKFGSDTLISLER